MAKRKKIYKNIKNSLNLSLVCHLSPLRFFYSLRFTRLLYYKLTTFKCNRNEEIQAKMCTRFQFTIQRYHRYLPYFIGAAALFLIVFHSYVCCFHFLLFFPLNYVRINECTSEWERIISLQMRLCEANSTHDLYARSASFKSLSLQEINKQRKRVLCCLNSFI